MRDATGTRMDALVDNVLRFAEVLRGAGLTVHAGRMSDVVIAIERVGVRRRGDVRAAMRCLLVHRREDVPIFDEAFDRFWRARSTSAGGLPLTSLGERPRVTTTPRDGASVQFESTADSPPTSTRLLAAAAWSQAEALRTKDFAELTPSELRAAEALLAGMPWHLGLRRTRRWEPARSGAIDLRRILRTNLARGGELIELPRRVRQVKPRPVVVLADVSGSMERYATMLLAFVYGMSRAWHDVESFVFSTGLTRITREVARGETERALAAVARRVRDWGGGTRIGDALRAFNVHYARRAMRHGPIVLIISDGWDRGDPARLAQELARIGRGARRLVWLNPLLGSDTYEPLTRGMRAALPLVDDFLPAHNIVSLEQLAEHLRSVTADGVTSRRG